MDAVRYRILSLHIRVLSPLLMLIFASVAQPKYDNYLLEQRKKASKS